MNARFLLVLATAARLSASAITPDGTWHEFVAYLPLGSLAIGCGATLCAPDTTTINPTADITTNPPWTFTGPASLRVLDLFVSGDRFEVFDNGVSLGLTSAISGEQFQCGTPNIGDVGCALADPRFSQGNWLLGGGSHSITITYFSTTTSVGHTGAALQLTAVPEPAPGWLLLLGLLSLRLRPAKAA